MKKMKQEDASAETKEQSTTTTEGSQDISPSTGGQIQPHIADSSQIAVENSIPTAAAKDDVDTMLVAGEQVSADAGDDGARSAANNTVTSVSIVIDSAEEELTEFSQLTEEETVAVEEQPEPEHKCAQTPEQQVDEEVPTANPEIKLQSILDYVKNRRHEFAKLLEEHAEIVHEINKFEGGVTS